MRVIDKKTSRGYKAAHDRLQCKGKAPLMNCPWQGGFQSRPRNDLRIQEPKVQMGEVNVTFKEPVHRIIDRIKNKPYFQ